MIKKAKTIRELYEEVKDFDLVITNDAPLATGLNRLVDKPRLGYLALTPKQISSKFALLYFDKIYEKYEVILSISRLSKKPIKSVHQLVGKIYEVWMYNAKLEFAEQFLTEEEKSLLKYIEKFNTIETAMENFNEEFYGNKSIAVIGEELFTLLDLEVLPRRVQPAVKIDIFKEGEFSLNKTYLFPSAEQLVENILELINNENADNTAIVLTPESDYLEILKSRLNNTGIKIELKRFLSDEMSVRNFISFAELSLRIDELQIEEFIPLAAEFGINIQSEFKNYDLSSYILIVNKRKKLTELYNISKKIMTYNYSELLSELKRGFRFSYAEELDEVLEILELKGKKISVDNLLELKYFLKEFNIETDSEKSGVLFANAGNAAFIDRQIIFYIGLDNSWMKLFPDKDYLNKEDEEFKNLERFQILLQQGIERFYFVQNVIDYKEVIPCYYFLMLCGNQAVNFSNEFFNPVFINKKKDAVEFKKREATLPMSAHIVETISPSGLNSYFECPKIYSFDKLLPRIKTYNLQKGNLMHNFAELYFNHPEYCKENFNSILDFMTNELSLFAKDANKNYIKSQFQIGAGAVVNFLDNSGLAKIKLESPEQVKGNILMLKFEKEKIYTNTEQWFSDKEKTKINGKIDLIAGNTIIDYKTSQYKKSETNATLRSNLDYINSHEVSDFDFQPIAYISARRKSNDPINFIYNFLLRNFKNQVSSQNKKEDNLTKIKYIPLTFKEYLLSKENFEYMKETFAKMKQRGQPAKLLNKLGYDNYKKIINELDLDESEYFDKKKVTARAVEVINLKIKELELNYHSFEWKREDTFQGYFIIPIALAIYDLRVGKMEAGSIFKDDADKFLEFVKSAITEINKSGESVFEFAPLFGSRDICKQCDYLNLCIGNKLWH